MSKFFPASGFRWLDRIKTNLDKYNDNSSRSCILDVDLKYPMTMIFLFAMLKYYFLTSSTKKTTCFITNTCNFI